jgi:hypothetical protein
MLGAEGALFQQERAMEFEFEALRAGWCCGIAETIEKSQVCSGWT